MKKIQWIFVLLFVLFYLTGCTNGIGLELSEQHDPQRFIWGGTDWNASIGEAGWFFVEGEQICFYDPNEKKDYILCSKANCSHDSDSCGAYFQLDRSEQGATGLIQAGRYLYLFRPNGRSFEALIDEEIEQTVDLVRVEPSTGQQKVVVSFPAAYDRAHPEDAYVSSIGVVQYCNGWLWAEMSMTQRAGEDATDYSDILVGIQLEREEIVYLNEFNSSCEVSLEMVGPERVYYRIRQYDVPPMPVYEFSRILAENGTVEHDGQSFIDYFEYCTWCWGQGRTFSYYIHELDGETQLLGTHHGDNFIPWSIYGEYEDCVVIREYADGIRPGAEGQHFRVFLMNLETGERTDVLEIKAGGALDVAQGYDAGDVFSDGRMFYADNMTESSAEIYCYDFKTGESTYLFTDDPAITFRIFGQYNGGYIGKHKDHQDDGSYYWISEEDFFAGNLDAMVRHEWK